MWVDIKHYYVIGTICLSQITLNGMSDHYGIFTRFFKMLKKFLVHIPCLLILQQSSFTLII